MTLLVALALAAEAYSAPLALPKVAKVEMRVERSREDIRAGKTTKGQSTAVYDKTIETTADGHRVTFKPVSVTQPDMGSPTDQAKLAAAIEQVSQQTFVYTADANLRPVAVEDWPQVVTTIRSALTKIVGDKPEGAQAIEMVTAMFSRMTPEQAAGVILREDGFLSMPVNLQLAAGQSKTWQENLPNPMGGPPIIADGKIVVETIDAARGVAALRWTQALDPASTRASMTIALKAMAAQLGKTDAAPTIEKLKLERTSSCLYEITLKTGLPTKADCSSLIAGSDPTSGQTATRTERWVLTQTLKN
ncbi:hypothetical protein [Caulobacter sp. RHG1]|uniref:hypothetical protein n=1 Tax=Caulobacter sp. (strain RHG1) TaxID=2545762 RepID=UPI001556DF17|nr:hypothetical protein [Caulobacter sp. RHG1]NQE62009.1 hypothetical protein [Caulobacter sp. RHG1]